MASIPNGVGIWWPGNHSAIPAGWVRNTDFDTRYNKGTAAGVNPDVTGGNANHQHVSPAHVHSTTAHSHSGQSGLSGGSEPLWPGGNWKAKHYHNYSTGNSTAVDSGTEATSWAASAQAAPFYKCIYIESNETSEGFPDDGIVYFNSATPPTDWVQHAASVDKFIVGADGSSGNGGGTGGGSHTHSTSAHSHTHADHTHAPSGASPQGVRGNQNYYAMAGAGKADIYHTHTFAVNTSSGGGGSSSTTSANTSSDTHDPEHVVMTAIQNNLGGGSWPEGGIAMWLGALSAIPEDWLLCDGNNSTRDLRGKQIKNAASSGSVGGTGGNAGHDHSDPAGHTHTSGHSHTAISSTVSDNNLVRITAAVGGLSLTPASHSHSGTTSNVGNLASGIKTVDALADTQPLFRTVAYIASPEAPLAPTNPPLFGALF